MKGDLLTLGVELCLDSNLAALDNNDLGLRLVASSLGDVLDLRAGESNKRREKSD